MKKTTTHYIDELYNHDNKDGEGDGEDCGWGDGTGDGYGKDLLVPFHYPSGDGRGSPYGFENGDNWNAGDGRSYTLVK